MDNFIDRLVESSSSVTTHVNSIIEPDVVFSYKVPSAGEVIVSNFINIYEYKTIIELLSVLKRNLICGKVVFDTSRDAIAELCYKETDAYVMHRHDMKNGAFELHTGYDVLMGLVFDDVDGVDRITLEINGSIVYNQLVKSMEIVPIMTNSGERVDMYLFGFYGFPVNAVVHQMMRVGIASKDDKTISSVRTVGCMVYSLFDRHYLAKGNYEIDTQRGGFIQFCQGMAALTFCDILGSYHETVSEPLSLLFDEAHLESNRRQNI
jgi:hypothetical protein